MNSPRERRGTTARALPPSATGPSCSGSAPLPLFLHAGKATEERKADLRALGSRRKIVNGPQGLRQEPTPAP